MLYNLGIMSYVERSRELATLKVLGFRNKNIGKLLISQNIWLTVIGVIIGLPAGVGVLEWLLAALAGEYELKLMLGPMTYCVSVLLRSKGLMVFHWRHAIKPLLITVCIVEIDVLFNCFGKFFFGSKFFEVVHLGF